MMEQQRRNVAGDLRALGSEMPDFHDPMGEKLEDGFMEFFRRQVRATSTLVAARRHGSSDNTVDAIAPL